MSTARLAARVEGVRVVGVGRLHHHELVFDKPGRDGTAKANVRRAAAAVVHGVVWEIEAAALEVLDGFERGYERSALDIVTGRRKAVVAWTYVYRGAADLSSPSDAYVRHLLDGAREHGLPGDFFTHLEKLGTID